MSDFCDLAAEWFDLTEDERCEALSSWILATAVEWDIEGLSVDCVMPPGTEHKAGVYDPDSETIHLNRNLFDDPLNLPAAANVAGHELRHAFQEEFYEDYGYTGAAEAAERATLEADAKAFADAFEHEVNDECLAYLPVESPWVSQADRARQRVGSPPYPLGDWELPPDDGTT